jgi:integrase
MKRTTGTLEKRGHVYYAVWTNKGTRHVVSTGQRDRDLALDFLAEKVAPFRAQNEVATMQAIQGRVMGLTAEAARLADAANPPLTMGDTWRAFLASPRRPDSGERTLAGYASHWNRFEEWAGDQQPRLRFLRDVCREHADAYAANLTAAKVSASTFNQHRNLLKLVWRCLGEEARCMGNPWESITLKKLNALATRKRTVTPAQFEALIATTENDPDLRDLLTLLAWTGLRLVDGVKMKWGAVDFGRGVITLAPQKTARRTGKQVHIPMFPAVRSLLDSRQSGSVLSPGRFVFPDLADLYDRDRGAALSKRIAAAFEKAGMQTSEERDGRDRKAVVFGAHSLRHFFVTVATSAGMPAAMIKSITGHATDAMLEHYQQIGVDLAGEVAARIGNGKPLALPAVAGQSAALPEIPPAVRAAALRILAALDAGDTDTARKEAATLAGTE